MVSPQNPHKCDNRLTDESMRLRMVQLATACLQESGYDLSWIHYTHVGHWYARLGYRTVIRWNAHGVVEG